jgi:hypothetical protein
MDISLAQHSVPFAPWRPEHGRVFEVFAFDTETTLIDDERPYLTPAYVLGAACDDQRGVFVSRENLPAFFAAHAGAMLIFHNAAFDLRVLDQLLKPAIDIYEAVEEDRVIDTMLMKQLHSLATAGHTARGQANLAACVKAHLGVELEKEQTDSEGNAVRTGFGQFLGRPPQDIPTEYLRYLAEDVLATYLLWEQLDLETERVLQTSTHVSGYVCPEWLDDMTEAYGPLTHHTQLKASILVDALWVTGIGIDQERREEKLQAVATMRDAYRERLRQAGFLVNEPGNATALQRIIDQFHRQNPDVELQRTESGAKWSAKQDDLAELAAIDPFFRDYFGYRQAEKLISTHLSKMNRPRLYPRFRSLLVTGRTTCGGGFNLQALPKETDLIEQDPDALTIRGVFVPARDHVLIDADLAQIELVVLGSVWWYQMQYGSSLFDLVNSGQDVHRLIAAAVLNKPVADVTREERNSVKAVSFGRPGGMGAKTLQKIARTKYGLELTLEDVESRIAAYHQLCPELDRHLDDEFDSGLEIAERLQLTQWHQACFTCTAPPPPSPETIAPVGYMGWMLLKVLRNAEPATNGGRPYTPEELEFLWTHAQQLAGDLDAGLAQDLADRKPSLALWKAARNLFGRRPVFTYTGRIRANAKFCAARNTLFQGLAADGALLGLWKVWRAGHRVVAFIHDQIVVECPADDHVLERKAEIERLMIEGMHEVIPGTNVRVESVVTRSLNKSDLDPRYQQPAEQAVPEPAAQFM